MPKTKNKLASGMCNKKMVQYWVRSDKGFEITIVWGAAVLWWIALFFNRVSHPITYYATALVITFFYVKLVLWIFSSNLSIKHSDIGKQMLQYGELKAMIRDVNEQALRAIYGNGNAGISPKYLFLMVPDDPNVPLEFENQRHIGILLLPMGEVQKVFVEEDSLYADEMNTMFFQTWRGKIYSMTIYRDYEETCRLKTSVEAYISVSPGMVSKKQMVPPAPKKIKMKAAANVQIRSVPAVYSQSKKVIVFACVFTIVISLVTAVLFVPSLLASAESITYGQAFGELLRMFRQKELSGLSGLWGLAIPVAVFGMAFILVDHIGKEVKRRYETLTLAEKEVFDRKTSTEKMGFGDVFYGTSHFWFRDQRQFFIYNLISYEEVLWIYTSMMTYEHFHLQMMQELPIGINIRSLVFHTKNGKKHTILMGDWEQFREHFPEAICGYGKAQKKQFKEMLKKEQ